MPEQQEVPTQQKVAPQLEVTQPVQPEVTPISEQPSPSQSETDTEIPRRSDGVPVNVAIRLGKEDIDRVLEMGFPELYNEKPISCDNKPGDVSIFFSFFCQKQAIFLEMQVVRSSRPSLAILPSSAPQVQRKLNKKI